VDAIKRGKGEVNIWKEDWTLAKKKVIWGKGETLRNCLQGRFWERKGNQLKEERAPAQ